MPVPVVLASLDWIRTADARTGLGVASIHAALQAAGVPCVVVGDAVNAPDFDLGAYIGRVLRALDAAGPGALLGVGCFVWNEPELAPSLEAVRAHSAARIVLGGPQVSYVAKGMLEALYPQADVFVRGHGEPAMCALAAGLPTCGLGVHYAGRADLGERADVDLGGLASPWLSGTLPIGANVRWETQRGCPFACSFCQHREPGNRLKSRNLAEERVFAEAARFAEAGVKRISVLDPIFHANRERAVRLLHGFRDAGLRAQLSLQCRFELVNDAFLDALEEMDVVLEFGLQTIHAEEGLAIGRPNKIDVADAVIHKLHARGIPFEVSLIYGLPLQTLDSFRRSVDWCLNRRVSTVRAWPLMLLRGTPLYDQRERWGFVESVGDRIPHVVSSASFSEADFVAMGEVAASLEAGAGGEVGLLSGI